MTVERATAKVWPHGERGIHSAGKQLGMPFVPQLSPELRATLMKLRDEAYNDGKADGRREVENEYLGNGIISFGVGALSSAMVWFIVSRIFA